MTTLHAIANICMYTLNISKYIYYIYIMQIQLLHVYMYFLIPI